MHCSLLLPPLTAANHHHVGGATVFLAVQIDSAPIKMRAAEYFLHRMNVLCMRRHYTLARTVDAQVANASHKETFGFHDYIDLSTGVSSPTCDQAHSRQECSSHKVLSLHDSPVQLSVPSHCPVARFVELSYCLDMV